MDLLEASRRGETDVVKALLKRGGVDPDKRDEDGATCLMFAAMRGHLVRYYQRTLFNMEAGSCSVAGGCRC